jgi:hypothetical protein
MSTRRNSLINKQVIILAVVFGILLCIGLFFMQVVLFPSVHISNENKFKLGITPFDSDRIKTLEYEISYEQRYTQAPMLPGVFSVGMTIKIEGTGGDGLRVREDPGTDKAILYLAAEGSEYKIIFGPEISDSLVWWKIQSLEDIEKTGWSVQDYFSTVSKN